METPDDGRWKHLSHIYKAIVRHIQIGAIQISRLGDLIFYYNDLWGVMAITAPPLLSGVFSG